uniref:Lysosome-associated membrane glycoprotein 5 n=1 Tax=Cacopsylla melanoneura TaxID=428564 RepID=A0A8D8RWG1_9HEMI
MKVLIGVPYVGHAENSTKLVTLNRVLSLPDTATASGTCGNLTHQSLKLSWVEANTSVSIEFGFSQNKTGFTLSSVNVSIPATADVFHNIVGNQTVFTLVNHNTSLPHIPVAQSFKCYSGVPLTLVDVTPAHQNVTLPLATFNLTHFQFEAFTHTSHNAFGAAVECAGDAYITPDIVPIAVGVALAALVAVVLVAYVIGRRRSNASGYLSM